MSQAVLIYNIEGFGPIMSVDVIRRSLRELRDSGINHPALLASIETVEELVLEGLTLPTVRLTPVVPGGGVVPCLATIEHIWQ